MKHVLILGATASIAAPLARMLAEKGVHLILAGRDEAELSRLSADLAIRGHARIESRLLDITHNQTDAASWLSAHTPALDAAFIFTGDMGEANALTSANIQQVISLNLTATACWLAALANHMRESGGVIAVTSSVAGDRGRASNYIYGAAKAGLTAFASGLRAQLYQEKSPLHILTIKPGFVDTPLTFALNSGLTAPREAVARDILRAAKRRTNTLYTPRKWWLIMAIIQHIPEVIFKRLRF